jgi:hypothetical protein
MAGENTEDQAQVRKSDEGSAETPSEGFSGKVGNVQGSAVVLGSNSTVTYSPFTLQATEYGAVMVMPDQPITISRRPGPVEMRQPRPELLDRDHERDACVSHGPTVIELFGETGIGKSTMLAALSHDLPQLQPDRFLDGVIVNNAMEADYEDVLYDIWSFFYQASVPWKVVPDLAHQRLQLQDISALVLLDDLRLNENEIRSLNMALSRSTLILATDSQRVTGFGTSIPVFGLPQQYLQSLAEIHLRRMKFSGPAIPESVLDEYWTEHQGNPLLIVRDISAWAMATSQRILPGLQSESAPAIQAAVQALGKPASASILTAVVEEPESGSIAEDHVKAGVFKANSPLYTYPHPPGKVSPEQVEVFRSRALSYLAQQPGYLSPADRPLALRLLRWATSHPGLRDEVIKVARKLSDAFMVAGYIGRWSETLQMVRRMTVVSPDDAATTSWVLHNLGAAAFCRGDNAEARKFLVEALRIRLDSNADAAAINATALFLHAVGSGGGWGGGSGAPISSDPLMPWSGESGYKPSDEYSNFGGSSVSRHGKEVWSAGRM